jgi:hypothetical protein
VQISGGPVRPGDTVWTPPGEKHWAGAAPTTAMVHLAMQEALDRKQIDRLEHVTQELYGRKAVNIEDAGWNIYRGVAVNLSAFST